MTLSKLFLKTVLLGFLCASMLGLMAYADDFLGQAEQQLFARTFTQDSPEDRLNRLETQVLGQPQSGSVEDRSKHLQSVLSQNIFQPDPNQPAAPADNTANTPDPPQPDATDYPSVTQLEQQVFHQPYTQENITHRLDRLEQSVFHRTYDNLPMVDRVDQLTLKVLPQSPLSVEENAGKSLPNHSQDLSSSNLAIYSELTTLENQVFGKSYGGEMLSNRLSRLERQLMGAPQHGSIDSRMQNLLARVSHNMHSNPPQQATIGKPRAYVPNVGGQSAPMGSNLPPQVTIGNQFGGGSGGFSQELMKMLPPKVQYQARARGLGASPGRSIQGSNDQPPFTDPSDISPDSGFYSGSSQSDSFFTPGAMGPGMPNSNPNNTQAYVPQRLSPFSGGAIGTPPTVMQRVPGSSPYSYGNSGNSQNITQSVALLEHRVFGQVFNNMDMGSRVNNLERQVFGMAYPQYSIQQRVNRLMAKSSYPQSMLPGSAPHGITGLAGLAARSWLAHKAMTTGLLPTGQSFGSSQFKSSFINW